MQPEKIGYYEIKSELGRGGMATVYRGYDPRFEREVAVKVLPPEMLHADPQFRVRFQREAKIIARLEHPSIVPVYDVGEENNQLYFVMRFMGGGSLAERIRERVYRVEEAARLLGQIAPGVDEAHAKGIVHRDLKPSNILFDNQNVPYISDFGIAKLTQADQSANVTGSAIIGTPAYMAPEQAMGSEVDGRADIYALGVILYEMLTGKQPYQADTPMGLAIKHITDPVPHILNVKPDLPAWIGTIVATAMAKDRNDRFSTAGEMLETMQAFLRGETPSRAAMPLPPSTMQAASHAATAHVGPEAKTVFARKNRLAPLAWLAPLFLVILAGGGFLLFRDKLFPAATASPSATAVAPTSTRPSPLASPSQTLAALLGTSTATLSPSDTPAPSLPVIGGADQIAFLRNNDIWVMNVDGSGLRALTTDGAKKFNLEWLPDGTLLYVTGMTLKTVDIETEREEIITSFVSAEYFDSFHVSPDGKQAAISLARELFVVPFDLESMKNVRKRSDLLDLKGCLFYDEFGVKDALWSDDGQKLAIKITVPSGNQRADSIRVMDIQQCSESDPRALDDFPVGRFPFKNTIVDFDWDGDLLFFFNSDMFKGGFGDLVFYNTFTHKFQKILPVENTCCYRDAAFSPDGTFVIFAFQDIRLGEASTVALYYMRVDALTIGGALHPIPLP
ncbi:MAG TPA: protein kinase, partial [Anaerolineales bacterium]|nr:protein kinase [Anaerolineales bacterium]